MKKFLLGLLCLTPLLANAVPTAFLATDPPLLSDPAAADKLIIIDDSETPDKVKRILYSDFFKNTGNLTLASTAAIRTSAVSGSYYDFSVYENDTANYRTVGRCVAGDTPYCSWAGTANAVLLIDAATLGGISPVAVTASSLTMSNGGAIGSNTTDANTMIMRGYDANDATYRTFITILNGNTPQFNLQAPSGGLLTIGNALIGGGSLPVSFASNSVIAGSGSATFRPSGAIDTNTTEVGNIGTGTDPLMSYAVPANTLLSGCVKHVVAGKTANNANAKTVNITINTGVVNTLSLATSVVSYWDGEVTLCRKGSNSQTYFGHLKRNGGVASLFSGSTSLTESAAITFETTASGTADNDVTQTTAITYFQ